MTIPMEIKPCPFCGDHDIFAGWTSAMTVGIKCRPCGIEMNQSLPHEMPDIADKSQDGLFRWMLKGAARRWNRRA